MAKYEFAVAVRDEEDNGLHKRIKKGHLTSYKPYPRTPGNIQLKNRLFITIYGLTEEEARNLVQPLYPEGKTPDEIDFIPEDDNVIKKVLRTPIAKRRYKVDLDKLKIKFPKIDLKKVSDVNLEYQPIKDEVIYANSDKIFYDDYEKKEIVAKQVKLKDKK